MKQMKGTLAEGDQERQTKTRGRARAGTDPQDFQLRVDLVVDLEILFVRSDKEAAAADDCRSGAEVEEEAVRPDPDASNRKRSRKPTKQGTHCR